MLNRSSAELTIDIAVLLKQQLVALASELDCGLQEVLMGCLYIYMQALHGVDAMCIGVPVHGRRTRPQKKIIGMLTQVVPVGLRPDAGTSFKELLGYVKQTLRSDLRHARSFLSSIVNQAAARWDTIGSPFETVARFLAYDYNVDFGAIRSEGIVLENDFADTPLVATLRNHAHDSLLTLTIKARSDVFDDESIIKSLPPCV